MTRKEIGVVVNNRMNTIGVSPSYFRCIGLNSTTVERVVYGQGYSLSTLFKMMGELELNLRIKPMESAESQEIMCYSQLQKIILDRFNSYDITLQEIAAYASISEYAAASIITTGKGLIRNVEKLVDALDLELTVEGI